MRRVKNCIIRKESTEDQVKAGRYNPSLELSFQDRSGIHSHKISAGYSDEISVYREDGLVFVLSHNARLGYAGLEVFKGEEAMGDVFLHGEELDLVMGSKEPSTLRMVKRLREALPV